MNRSDRLLLEHHVKQLDQMQRTIIEMRSVLTRRIRRLIVTPTQPPAVVREHRRRITSPLMVEQGPPEVTIEPLNLIAILQAEQVLRPVAVVTPRETLKIKTKTLKATEQDTLLPDACAVCLCQHTKMDTTVLNCNHQFGKECFRKWKIICIKSDKDISCPTCRQKVTITTIFKINKPRINKIVQDTPVLPHPPIQTENIINIIE